MFIYLALFIYCLLILALAYLPFKLTLSLKSFWVRLFLSAAMISAFLVVTQNIQIFPGAVAGLFHSSTRDLNDLPSEVESKFIKTKDGERLEVWSLPSTSEADITAVIFHGNAGDIVNFFPYQKYLSSIGFNSVAIEYRGYGKSSGWPTERGLEKDADTVINYLNNEKGISLKKMVIVGISIGSGPASYAASKYKTRSLVLFAPFVSLPRAIREVPLMGLLSSFSLYKFPVKEYVSKLEKTSLLVIHGKRDKIISQKQGIEVYEAYEGIGKSEFIDLPSAGHNNILSVLEGLEGTEVKKSLLRIGVVEN